MTFVGLSRACLALAADILCPAGGRSEIADRILARRARRPVPAAELVRCKGECQRDLPPEAFSPVKPRAGRKRTRHPWCRECAALYNRRKRRPGQRAPRSRPWRATREQSREYAAARWAKLASERPAYGRCVVCGGPVPQRPQYQRKTCLKPGCVSAMKSRIMKVQRATGRAVTFEEATRVA